MLTLSSLGFINVAASGTPIALAAATKGATRIRIQPRKDAVTTNTGNIYIMCANLGAVANPGSIYAILSPEQVEGIELIPVGSNAWDLAQIWLDADNNGDGALIGLVQGG